MSETKTYPVDAALRPEIDAQREALLLFLSSEKPRGHIFSAGLRRLHDSGWHFRWQSTDDEGPKTPDRRTDNIPADRQQSPN
jgi:hypothetical protein